MKKALIIGGNSGIGLALVDELLTRQYEFIYIVGIDEPDLSCGINNKIEFLQKTTFMRINLINEDMSWLDNMDDINTLIFTAGFGRVTAFENLEAWEISNLVKVNELAFFRIIRKFYGRILSENDFYCVAVASIAGHLVSPLFAVYGATKSALAMFIENINAELQAVGTKNRILDVSPGSLAGTSFNGQENQLQLLENIPRQIIQCMLEHQTLFIPHYNERYKKILNSYIDNKEKFALESYKYKIKNDRCSDHPQGRIGYLSGTFDLFHIGHLNLLRKAKDYCDYLIVGVHKSGAWKSKETFIPFNERMEILSSIKYVDKVVEAYPEDSDAWYQYHYNYLFVGSDYKGTERFSRYEKFFEDENVKIIYFQYTAGTSSTQLREKLNNN